jgi:hypothetical protein
VDAGGFFMGDLPRTAKEKPIRPGFDNNLGMYAGLAAAIAKIDSKGGIEV